MQTLYFQQNDISRTYDSSLNQSYDKKQQNTPELRTCRCKIRHFFVPVYFLF